MQSASLADIFASDDIYLRAAKNFERMHGKEYQIPGVFRSTAGNGDYDWPGDHEGRSILALTLLSQAIHKDAEQLEQIVTQLPKHLNERGYLGRICPDGIMDEQQISGHSWLLRGLCEYYLWKADPRVLEMIEGIVRGLLIPGANAHTTYPIEPQDRTFGGAEVGNLTGIYGNWHISSDIGCAFIMLDGATHAYELLRDPSLKLVIDNAIERFSQIDLIAMQMQAQATLSALRGILRYYKITGEGYLLDLVKNRYAVYRSEAITENYANYNWFTRPEWTEACGIIDSFIIAVWLWEATSESSYLEDAHRIYFNGLGHAQCPNGGWGLDMCVGSSDEFITRETYEAWWCCSMRGGEGLARAAEYLFWTDDDTITLPFYCDSTARLSLSDGEIILKESTGYPINGDVQIEVVQSDTQSQKTLRFYVPEWVKSNELRATVNGVSRAIEVSNGFAEITAPLAAGTKIGITFSIALRIEKTINKNTIPGYHTYWHGPLILGIPNDGEAVKVSDMRYVENGRYRVEGTDHILAPINDTIYSTEEAVMKDRRQLLFRK